MTKALQIIWFVVALCATAVAVFLAVMVSRQNADYARLYGQWEEALKTIRTTNTKLAKLQEELGQTLVSRGEATTLAEKASRFYAEALVRNAVQCFDARQYNRGHVYLSAALHYDMKIGRRHLNMLDMVHPEFPCLLGFAGNRLTGAEFAAFSESGDYLVYMSGGKLRRFQVDAGRETAMEWELGAEIRFLAVSPSGRYVAVGDGAGAAALYDADRPGLVAKHAPQRADRSGQFVSVCFSPREDEVALCCDWGQTAEVQIRKTADFELLGAYPASESVRTMCYDRNGAHIFLGETRRLEMVTREGLTLHRLFPSNLAVWSVDYCAEGDWIALGCWNYVFVYEAATGYLKLKQYVSAGNVTHVQFLSGGKYIAYGTSKQECGIIDVASSQLLQTFPLGGNVTACDQRKVMAVGDVALDLRQLDNLSYDGAGDLFEYETQIESFTDLPADLKTHFRENEQHEPGKVDVAVNASPSRRYTAYATFMGGQTVVYDHNSDKARRFLSDFWSVRFYCFSNRDRWLLRLAASSNGLKGVVELCDLSNGDVLARELPSPPASFAIPPAEDFVVVVDESNRVHLLEIPTLSEVGVLLDVFPSKREAAFREKGDVLLVRTGDRTARYDFRKVRRSQPLTPYERAVQLFGYEVDGMDIFWRGFGKGE